MNDVAKGQGGETPTRARRDIQADSIRTDGIFTFGEYLRADSTLSTPKCLENDDPSGNVSLSSEPILDGVLAKLAQHIDGCGVAISDFFYELRKAMSVDDRSSMLAVGDQVKHSTRGMGVVKGTLARLQARAHARTCTHRSDAPMQHTNVKALMNTMHAATRSTSCFCGKGTRVGTLRPERVRDEAQAIVWSDVVRSSCHTPKAL